MIFKSFRAVLLPVLLCLLSYVSLAQDKQYQGLLWEITGNSMSKPSYLYGTMHVSNKLAFHLGEPFFAAINGVDEVALELNPADWLSDYISSENFLNNFYTTSYIRDYSYFDPFERNLDIKHDQKDLIKNELADDPTLINGFMFRSDKSRVDFQENTYLDLYIYQTARKFGKNVMGLETLAELDRDNDNADKAKAGEDHSIKTGKNSSYYTLGEKLEEAYRRGDLYELDSLNQLMSTDSTREYIIFKRNVLMVERMTKTMKQHPLLTGVGAAHLPGDKGVIELLRKKGYKVRAVDMGDRDADRREKLENQIVPREFSLFTSPDSIFSVEVPDKMFCIKEKAAQQDYICADMTNGTYFTVARLKSYAAVTRFNREKVQKIVDSLLYENIPGKLIEQKNIEKDGVPGISILNKTRKGDFQAYNIMFTDDEILIFKVSGTNENAKSEYGQHFLNSIHLYVNGKNNPGWHTYTCRNQSFSLQLPAQPVDYLKHERMYSGSKMDLLAKDDKTDNSYLLIRTSISNPDYMEEDTFEMSLMAEDYCKKNTFKAKQRHWDELNGRKALRVFYSTPDSQSCAAMFIIQNLNFYCLAAFYTKDSSMNERFFSSLKFSNPAYSNFQEFTDTILHFKVKLPYKQLITSSQKTFSYGSVTANPVKYLSKAETFTPPQSFETVEVNYYQYSPYYQAEDTATYMKRRRKFESHSNDFVVKRESVHQKGDMLILDFLFADTNSSRQVRERTILKNQARYIISAYVDTSLRESKYVDNFFESFTPADTNIGTSIFKDHTHLFLTDILSKDSMTRVHALEEADETNFNVASAPSLIDAFGKIPNCQSYADIKTELFRRFNDIKSKTVLPFLEKSYHAAGDTSQFQFAILGSLARMHMPEAVELYGKLMTSDPPLSDDSKDVYETFEHLYDSLSLTKSLFPDLLDLSAIQEYKYEVYALLSSLVDSNLIKSSLYKNYKGIMLNQAKMELKRESGTRKGAIYAGEDNSRVEHFSNLLIPFYKDQAVKDYFNHLLATDNMSIKMMSAILLKKNSVPVADSIWLSVAKEEKNRVWLYSELEKSKLLAFYPKEYLSQSKFNESIIRGFIPSETNPLDSLVMLLNVPGNYRGDTGRVYLYKYKVSKDKDWKLAMLGLLPEDETKVDAKYEIYDLRSEYLDAHKTAQEQLREMIFKLRKKKKRDSN